MKHKIVFYLSDTSPTFSDIGAPGFYEPTCFKRDSKLGLHILNGKRYCPEADMDELNKISENLFRGGHRHHYPVLKIVPDDDGVSGAEAFTVATIDRDIKAPPTEESETLPPPPPFTPSARKEAQRLGVDIAMIPTGTGAGGIITKDDVQSFWRASAGDAAAPAPAAGGPGNLSMAQLIAASNQTEP